MPPPTSCPSPSAAAFHRHADTLTGALIYFMVVFGPWAFGTSQAWAIRLMNGVGFALGGLFLLKLLVRWRTGYQPPQWGAELAPDGRWEHPRAERVCTGLLAALTLLLLGYCLASAGNARATYRPESWSFEYHPFITCLPHSYDRLKSWEYFWMYLGLAGFFWAVRDWILTREAQVVPPASRSPADDHPHSPSALLPPRPRRLLWLLSLNGALLAGEGIIQRVDGTGKLLWLVEPRVNKEAVSQFGPYAYRSNAAQYFNLLWPVTLGFWWTCQRARRHQRRHQLLVDADENRYSPPIPLGNKHHLLLPCAMLMAVCPLVTTSRGGAIILGANVILAGAILLMAQWHSDWTAKLALLLLLGSIVGGGVLLGWEDLGPRLELVEEGLQQRESMFIAGRRMAADNPVFGTGPGTFDHLFQFYRYSPQSYWPAQLHNDWLETLITFGGVGTGLIGLALLVAVLRWFAPGGLYGEKHFVMLIWIALMGCLIHARFDFPFQIHSLLALFLLLCSLLSCLSRR